jgi:hypothetical protein
MPEDAGVRKAQKRIAPVPLSANAFVAVAAALAVVLLVLSWRGHVVTQPALFAFAFAAAALCGSRGIRISRQATLSVGAAIVLAAMIHLGLAEALVLAAVSGLNGPLLSSEQHRRPLAVIAFAGASIVITAWAAGQVFVRLGGGTWAVDVVHLAVPALFAVATYQTVNCALVSAVAGLHSRKPFWPLFCANWSASALAFYGAGAWAVLVHLALLQAGFWILLASLPLLYALHGAIARLARYGSEPATDP